MMKFSFHPFHAVLGMIAISALVLYTGLSLSTVKISITPKEASLLPWFPDIEPDVPVGKTKLTVTSEGDFIAYDFFLSASQVNPWTGYNFNFQDDNNQRLTVDLSHFDHLTFKVSCSPRNILLLVLFTFHEDATDIQNPGTYRINWHFFTCNQITEKYSVLLTEFETPDWWLQNSGLELVDREYDLEKVLSFGFINSLQSPREVQSSAKFSDVAFIGRNWVVVWTTVSLLFLLWIVFTVWAVRRYLATLVDVAKLKMQQDLPLIAYQKLSIAPQKDKAKDRLMRHLATEYANPELSIDTIQQDLGISRNKINDILKEELGLTCAAYVNRLRLTEAARLLPLHPEESISQIAYKVGFNNVTYFNKLFKSAYGCSPKQYRSGGQQSD